MLCFSGDSTKRLGHIGQGGHPTSARFCDDGRVTFWDSDFLDCEDDIAKSIWTTSRDVQRHVLAARSESPVALLQSDLDLPWVPDLAGSWWAEQGGVFVIGSAYSPFIDGHAGRSKAMGFRDYNPNAEAIDFQRAIS